jgi:hypothetical protein
MSVERFPWSSIKSAEDMAVESRAASGSCIYSINSLCQIVGPAFPSSLQ